MKNNTRPSFLHRAFPALAALALLPAVAQSASVPLTVAQINVDRGDAGSETAVFRTGDTIRVYVVTEPFLDDSISTIPSNFKLNLRLKSANSEVSRSATFVEMNEVAGLGEGVPALIFEYTVQGTDKIANGAVYTATGSLFSGTLTQIRTTDGDSVQNFAGIQWATPDEPLVDFNNNSAASFNPPVILNTTSICADEGFDSGRYRAGDTLVIYVETVPVLDPNSIPANLVLNFRLRPSTSARYARTAEYVRNEGDSLVFEYLVQEEDETPNNAIYATGGNLYSGALTDLQTADGQSFQSIAKWATPNDTLPNPVYLNPKATLTITGYEFDRTGNFVTDQTIGIFVKTEPMLDNGTLDQDFTFNFRFSEKDGIRNAVFRGIETAPSGDEALYFTYTVVESDYSSGNFFRIDAPPLFGNADYPFPDVRTIEGDKIDGLRRFNPAPPMAPEYPEDPIATDIIVNPSNAQFLAIHFLDSDGNRVDPAAPYQLQEGDRTIKYVVDIGHIPRNPVTVTIDWGAANVFKQLGATDTPRITTVEFTSSSRWTGTIDRILDNGAVGYGSIEYDITATRSDGGTPAIMIASYQLVGASEFVDGILWKSDFVDGGVCLTGADIPANTESVVIPSFIQDFRVIAIGDDALRGPGVETIASLTIPRSVKTISPYAFSRCGNIDTLVISLPSPFRNSSAPLEAQITNLTVVDSFFVEAGDLSNLLLLRSLTLPATIVTMDANALTNCPSLLEVHFLGDAPEIIGTGLYNAKPRRLVTYVPEWSIGWDGGFTDALPDLWQGRMICHEGSSGTGPGGMHGGESPDATETLDGVTWTYAFDDDGDAVIVGAAAEDAPTTVAIPATLGGCSVRTVGPYAFASLPGVQSVAISEGIEGIGAGAFERCTKLASITLPSTLTSIGDSAFRECVSLAAIEIPAAVTNIGYFAFRDCLRLESVDYAGEPPHCDLGAWDRVPAFAIRTADGGFVTVVTDIVNPGEVSVPEDWALQYPRFEECFGSDFTAALAKPTGKRDAEGNLLFVWQDYVAGTDPTDIGDRFIAKISIVNGSPVVSWEPKLSAAEAAKRRYTILGKTSLASGEDWTPVPAGHEADYNFFKVTVEMK